MLMVIECVSLGLSAVPVGLPQATLWVIRVHVSGVNPPQWAQESQRAHCSTSLLMSGQALSLPTIYLNVNQLGRSKGLTLCLRVIIICIFFSFLQLIDWPWSAVVLVGVTVTAS